METSIVTSKGQVVIPSKLRRKYGIKNGTRIHFYEVNGEMYYIALREGGEGRAELYKSILVKYPITIIEANKELTLHAARYKAFHRISYS